jgi:hypothetical protein
MRKAKSPLPELSKSDGPRILEAAFNLANEVKSSCKRHRIGAGFMAGLDGGTVALRFIPQKYRKGEANL